MREAVARARAVFAPRDGVRPKPEPWLFAHHVRWELKQLLQDALPLGTPVSIDEDTIMSSVVVHIEDLEIRLRKSTAPGEVPPPGDSPRMIGWYAQTLDGSVAHNLLLLWHVDANLDYTGLDVAFPSGGTEHTPFVRWIVELVDQPGVADDLDIRVSSVASTNDRAAGNASP